MSSENNLCFSVVKLSCLRGYFLCAVKNSVILCVTVKNGSTTLVNGTDYSVSYSNNTNIGTATVTITGKGTYSG